MCEVYERSQAMEYLTTIKKQVYTRASGKCECLRVTHDHSGRCKAALGSDWYVHPKTSLSSTEDISFSNAEALCVSCHKARQNLAIL
jgi:hypothetical protein